MSQTAEGRPRTLVEKLGVRLDDRVEIVGELPAHLRRELRAQIGRGFVRSGELDGAVVAVRSLEEADEALARYRARIRDTGWIWILTRKRGHDDYLNQMTLVPPAKQHGLIDNKTCSIDDEHSAIRFVIPRALRGQAGDAPAAG